MDDPQIAELKELIRQNIAVATDTNKIVHAMRTGSRLKSLFWFLIFCLSIGSTVYSYFYFVAPRIEQIRHVYETNIVPLQKTGNSITDFINKFGQGTTTAQ